MPSISNIYFSQHISQGAYQLPVLLIHGAGSSHLSWPAELRRLPGFHTVALDLPGHGRSRGVGFHHLKMYSQSLLEFLAAAGWYRVFLIGHSMGGAIAMQFSLDYPDHVAGLGLINSAASFTIPAGIIESFRSVKTAEIGRQEIQQLIAPLAGEKRWYLSAADRVWDARTSLWYADLRACANFDIRARVHQIFTPTLVLAGSEDPLVPYSSAAFLAGEIPNARLITHYQNGHMLMLEQPAEVGEQIQQFLNATKPEI